MRDDPATPATELDEILASTPLDEHRRLHHGGRGARTGLLCGGFALEGGHAHPILRALPPALRIAGASGHPVPWLAATFALLTDESASRAPGAEEVVTRLAEALLTQALRVGLAEIESADGAGVLALRDPQIAAAIGVIHGRPERAWTVGEVAAEVALSRSAFSARFRQLVGESPTRYVTRTRLARGRTVAHHRRLAGGDRYASGLRNRISFGKAFKRTFGVAPGAYRGQPNGVPGLHPASHAPARVSNMR